MNVSHNQSYHVGVNAIIPPSLLYVISKAKVEDDIAFVDSSLYTYHHGDRSCNNFSEGKLNKKI